MAIKPIQVRVTEALDKIGKTNGTVAPNIAAPAGATNEEAEAFHDDRNAAFEYMIASQIKSYAEKREKSAKEKIHVRYHDIISNTPPSTTNAAVRGDMSLSVEKRKGRQILDGAMLMSALARRGFDLDTCEAIIKEATKDTNPALYLRASLIRE